MIELGLSPAALGETRFGRSPMAEVAGSLRALGAGGAGSPLQPWVREVRPRLGAVDMALLLALAPPGRVAPDFLFACSSDPRTTIRQQVDAVAALPVEVIDEQLRQVWAGRQVPQAVAGLLRGRDAPGRVAQAVADYWGTALAPYWERMSSVLDDDVDHRVARLLAGGLYAVLGDLHPEITVLDGRLLVDKPRHEHTVVGRTRVTLVPSVFVWPDLVVSHDLPDGFVLTYPARGVARVWEASHAAGGVRLTVLTALLGQTRARILLHLATPMSTTQLARDLRRSPASVSAHLSVLRSSGLLSSRRSGRSVLYRRTELASSIVAAHGRDRSR